VTGLLLAAVERLPVRARRVVVAVGALLLLALAIAAVTLTGPREGGRPRGSASPPRAPAVATNTSSPRLLAPVSGAELTGARLVAERFLAGYLPFAYGRASAATVAGVTPGLSRQLLQERVAAPPAERARQPRVVSLQLVGTTPGFAVATAVIDDGALTAYRLRVTVQRQSGRWAVSSVVEG
jgi:hypothetical protein